MRSRRTKRNVAA